MDGHRVEDPLHRRPVLLAELEGIVRHALHHLERVASLAAILVDGHGTLSIGVPEKGDAQAFSGGLGLSRSSRRDTRAACQTIHAVMCEIGRRAKPTIYATVPQN